MTESNAPDEVTGWAQERQQARADRDFAQADALRDRIREAGWLLVDTAEGWSLAPAPPFASVPQVNALPDRSGEPSSRELGIGVIVDGWPSDVRTCLQALIDHAPANAVILALDLGDVDGAGLVVHEFASQHPGRIEELHVDAQLQTVGWAAARQALLQADTSRVHAVMDLSTVVDGDAFGPLLAMLDADPALVAVGWRGVNVDVDDQWRSFVDSGPGECDALLSYLFLVRRDAAAITSPHPKARFYRNADMEWSLALREAGGTLAQGPSDLPVHQERHRGYHDSDQQFREKESKRTYDRLLQRFRGRTDLLAPRRSDASPDDAGRDAASPNV